MRQEFHHDPVMLDEVLALFEPVADGLVIDATLGGGGHAAALLERRSGVSILGIDRDPAAIRAASDRLAPFGTRATVRHARFDEIDAVFSEVAPKGVRPVGVLFDLGVSSPQLDDAERGFSLQRSGPIDMRMDTTRSGTAADIVNGASQAELRALFAANDERRFADRIARAIVTHRPITTTTELAELVAVAVPAAARRRGHPARRVFQALRIAVNEELDQLPGALDRAIDLLSPGGRIVVLSYHSGEDRMTKERLGLAATGGCTCPPGLPCVCGAEPTLRLLNRGARMPTADEVARNPRAASARLRAGERLADTHHDEDGDV